MLLADLTGGQSSVKIELKIPGICICRDPCLGLIMEGGYMFLLDPDMSSFPLVTWRCPKFRCRLQNNFEHRISAPNPMCLYCNPVSHPPERTDISKSDHCIDITHPPMPITTGY